LLQPDPGRKGRRIKLIRNRERERGVEFVTNCLSLSLSVLPLPTSVLQFLPLNVVLNFVWMIES
jgi:hypothetical protein